MHTSLTGIGLIVALLFCVSHAYGQEATEQFIPIGQSPGLSNQYTYIGEIEGVNPQERTITLGGGKTVRVSDQTRIWMDRTELKATNQVGHFSDLKSGQSCEVKYVDLDRKRVADWIKIKIVQP